MVHVEEELGWSEWPVCTVGILVEQLEAWGKGAGGWVAEHKGTKTPFWSAWFLIPPHLPEAV